MRSPSESRATAFGLPLDAHRAMGVGIAYFAWTDTSLVRAVDADPALAAARRGVPWPLSRHYRVEQLVPALVGAAVAARVSAPVPRPAAPA